MGLFLTSICLLSLATFHLGAASPVDGERQGTKKLVCYYTNWSSSRSGNSAFFPSDIDASLCTHIIYSFSILDATSLEMVVTSLKSQGVKVLIAIGGWNDSEGDKYSRMVTNPASRANFVTKAVEFIRRYNFDGLDLDWEYPSCPQGACGDTPASDKQNFANLLRELRTAFLPHGFLLSAAVSASSSIAARAYDIPTLNSQLDWIGLMTYDMHGGWDGVTGHNSPFRGASPNTVDTITYWLQNGATAAKLVVGVPLYGRSFTLSNPNNNGVGAPASNGAPGEYTGEAGFLAYFELCMNLAPFTHVPQVGPYGFRGTQWASFDNTQIIGDKTGFIMQQGLAGAMVWAIDLDDFNGGFCGAGEYPLLKALKAGLGI
ncbi:putative chitinase 3 [Folsomia candida]|uniref:Putative chitinase 3 n=1 Tax=Folsomia candida TaxID=158441 RepID=A0A226EJK8_FOLCA|nr:putative chitinase 3 [Folsomia candida]